MLVVGISMLKFNMIGKNYNSFIFNMLRCFLEIRAVNLLTSHPNNMYNEINVYSGHTTEQLSVQGVVY